MYPSRWEEFARGPDIREVETTVCTENLVRVAGVNESPKLAR
jgi:hypothetical protein